MLRYIATTCLLIFAGCNSTGKLDSDNEPKVDISTQLPQTTTDTFYYDGVLSYVAHSGDKRLDSTRHEITKLYQLKGGRFSFQFVMSNYLPFLADLGNPADTFSTVPYQAVFTLGSGRTFTAENKKEGFRSRLQFLQNDSLFFDEEWTFPGLKRNEHWTFKGKRIK